jgi:hypothetical protein
MGVMVGDLLTVEVSGVDEMYKDLNDKAATAELYISEALNYVGSELTESLKRFIQTQVYDVYQPLVYPRRADNPQFGDGLASDSYISYNKSKKGMNLTFVYEPKGYHKGKVKDIDPTHAFSDIKNEDKPIKPNPVHGDALINRIQTGNGYDWNLENSPQVTNGRPFWNMFVANAKSETIPVNFTKVMREFDEKFFLSENDIEWQQNESMLEGRTFGEGFGYIPEAYIDPYMSMPISDKPLEL